jgi:hypothetical protein
MGSEDVKRQSPNVYRMHLLGAKVVPVESGSKTLKDALNEALRDWVTNVENTFYIIGTVAGPHPYPMMVRDFQRVIGDECLLQMPQMIGRQPDAVIACVGGGSNAMGIFYPYIRTRRCADRRRGRGRGPAHRPPRGSLSGGTPGRAARQPHLPAAGRQRPDHRDALGLGRPGLPRRRPRARLPEGHRPRRVRGITDDEALAAFHRLCRTEGIIPALESSHAVAYAMKLAATMRPISTCWSTCPAAATRTSAPWPTCPGASSSAGRRAAGRASRAASWGCAMSRIAATMAALKAQGRKALIPYVTAGDPVCRRHAEVMHALAPVAPTSSSWACRFRPDGRWPGDPEGRRAALGARHRPAPGAGHGAQLPNATTARRWC